MLPHPRTPSETTFGPNGVSQNFECPVLVLNALLDKNSFYETASPGSSPQSISNRPVCKTSVLGPMSSAAKNTLFCRHLSGDHMNTCPDPTDRQIKGRRTAVDTAVHHTKQGKKRELQDMRRCKLMDQFLDQVKTKLPVPTE